MLFHPISGTENNIRINCNNWMLEVVEPTSEINGINQFYNYRSPYSEQFFDSFNVFHTFKTIINTIKFLNDGSILGKESNHGVNNYKTKHKNHKQKEHIK